MTRSRGTRLLALAMLAAILIAAGCGRSEFGRSNAGSGNAADTVALSMNVIWPSSAVQDAETLSAKDPDTAPAGITTISATITVGTFTTSQSFAASAGAGSISAPAGSGNLTLNALNSSGTVIYTGTSGFSGAAGSQVTVTVAMGLVPGQSGSAWTYAIGGAVSGLTGTLVLQDNGGDNLTLSTNASFTFATHLTDGAAYNVTVLTQPAVQTCTVANGNGTVVAANVTNVDVTCVIAVPSAPTGLIASASGTTITLTWTASSGATSYNAYYSTSTGVTPSNGTKITGVTSGSALPASFTPGTTYYLVVTAVDSAGESPASNQASANTSFPEGVWDTSLWDEALWQ